MEYGKFGAGALTLIVVASLIVGRPSPSATHAAGLPASIGLVADITGSASVYGVSIRNGAQLAANLLNKAAGLNGQRFSLDVGDAASSNTHVISLYQQDIANAQVLGIVGPTLSSEAFKADPIAQKAGIPVLATSNTAAGVTAMGTYIFRMSLGEADVVPLTIKTAMAHLHFRKVAVLYGNDNAFTISDGMIFAAVAKALKLEVLDTETFATGDKDFKVKLSKIKGMRPDAVLVGALAPEAVLILTQARQLGIPSTVHIIGGNGFNSPAVISGAGSAAEGTIEGTAWFPNSKNPTNLHFLAAYKDQYGKVPDQFAAQAFDGVNIMAAGIKLANTTRSRAAVRDALSKIKNVPVVSGVSGTFSFLPSRDAREAGTVQIIQGGQFVQYK